MPRSKNKHTRRAQKRRKKLRQQMRNDETRKIIAEKKHGYAGWRMCGRKTRYPNEMLALTGGLSKYGIIPNVYRCPVCHGWHITHGDTE